MTSRDLTALSDARVGTTGVVERVDLPDEVSHYLAHLGFLPGTSVEVLRQAPAGDPRVYRIDGVEVGLRKDTARHIFLKVSSAPAGEPKPARKRRFSRRAAKPEVHEGQTQNGCLGTAGVAA